MISQLSQLSDNIIDVCRTSKTDTLTEINIPQNVLCMWDLDPRWDENSLSNMYANFGEIVKVNLTRGASLDIPTTINNISSSSLNYNNNYCFLEFTSAESCLNIMNTLNGTKIPNTNYFFRLSRISDIHQKDIFNSIRQSETKSFSIFVGDLAPDTTEPQLLQLFQSRYASCTSVKIMVDPLDISVSRGYGFVRFTNEDEMNRSIIEMNGFVLNNRAFRIDYATPKSRAYYLVSKPEFTFHSMESNSDFSSNTNDNYSYYSESTSSDFPQLPLIIPFSESQNTTVFIGGLANSVDEEDIRRAFSPFGDIVAIKIPFGKGCGFVQYVYHSSARDAIIHMQGYLLGKTKVRLSWGRYTKSQSQTQHKNTDFKSFSNTTYNIDSSRNISSKRRLSQSPVLIQSEAKDYRNFQAAEFPDNTGHSENYRSDLHFKNSRIYPALIHPLANIDSVIPGDSFTEDQIPISRLNELYLAVKTGTLDRVT